MGTSRKKTSGARSGGKGARSKARGTAAQRVERLASAASTDATAGVSSVAGNQPKSGESHGADAASRVSAGGASSPQHPTGESEAPRAATAGVSQTAAGDDEDAGPLLTGLDARRDRAILALLAEPTVEKAAEAAGVSTRTLHRWLAEPTFSRAFCEARRRSFLQAIALTHRYAPLAVQTLARVLADHGTSSHARVHAASVMLRFSRESIELDDLAERLDELERRGVSAEA